MIVLEPAWARPTVLTAWTGTLLRALDERGIDGRELARSVGIEPELLDEPDQRLPLSDSTRLWERAIEVTDEAFGIEVSRHARPTAFHGLGPAFLASATLRRALERAARYGRVAADIAVGSAHMVGSDVVLRMVWEPVGSRPADASLDAVVATIVRAARFMLDPSVSPSWVELQRPEPSCTARFDGFFRCPIRYGTDGYAIAYDRGVAERRIVSGNDAVAGASESVVAAYLAAHEVGSVVDRVREALTQLLPSGEPSVAEVARLLHTSCRTLQRQLGDHGTSFREVLRYVRHELAVRYLHDPSISVTEIAFLLGFSETAAFSRAFKRWTGSPPSQQR